MNPNAGIAAKILPCINGYADCRNIHYEWACPGCKRTSESWIAKPHLEAVTFYSTCLVCSLCIKVHLYPTEEEESD